MKSFHQFIAFPHRFCWAIFLFLHCSVAWGADVCQPKTLDSKPPAAAKPKMGRFVIQDIYLGMSHKELKLIKPGLRVRPLTDSGVIHEFVGELRDHDEELLFIFTLDARLYKLVYQKRFKAAVDENELALRLTQRYGRPEVEIKKPTSKKVFEICWGQCDMITDGVFCQDEDTEAWYTYFTASLDSTRKRLSLVLHDSGLFERNELLFAEKKETKKLSDSTESLDQLDL